LNGNLATYLVHGAKLSCGNLTIARPSFNATQKCVWCTLALYASLSKFKTGEEEYKAQIKDKDEVMVGDPVLAKLDAKTVEKEAELEELRKAAWEKRNGILKDFQSSRRRRQHSRKRWRHMKESRGCVGSYAFVNSW
jgi:hypothetical protein